VNEAVAGFSIQTAGVILIVAGVPGLAIGLFLLMSRRPREGDRAVYEDCRSTGRDHTKRPPRGSRAASSCDIASRLQHWPQLS
jgi:hypothetical protein